MVGTIHWDPSSPSYCLQRSHCPIAPSLRLRFFPREEHPVLLIGMLYEWWHSLGSPFSVLTSIGVSNFGSVRFTNHQRKNNSANICIKSLDGLYFGEPRSWASLHREADRCERRCYKGRRAWKKRAGAFLNSPWHGSQNEGLLGPNLVRGFWVCAPLWCNSDYTAWGAHQNSRFGWTQTLASSSYHGNHQVAGTQAFEPSVLLLLVYLFFFNKGVLYLFWKSEL